MTFINDLISKYSSNFPQESSEIQKVSGKKNVIVTGTTGSLGYYLLLSLLKDDQIGTIYCLNRSATAKEAFLNRYQNRAHRNLAEKLKFLRVAFGEDSFGLSDGDFDELLQEVDIILHNAWKVHWYLELKYFEPQIRGLHTFISLSLSSSRRPSIHFVSTTGTANNSPPNNTIPEYVLSDPKFVGRMGYTKSKFVAENILDKACQQYHLNGTILRLGQIAGPISDPTGVWNKNEWFPSMMQTSKNMGLIPESMGNALKVNWIPVDTAADIVMDIVNSTSEPQSFGSVRVFNIVNPTEVPYRNLSPAIKSYFGDSARLVPFEEWLHCLSKIDKNEPGALEKYPVLRIPTLVESLQTFGVKYEIDRAMKASRTMREMKGVSGDMTKIWLRQWKL